MPAAPSKHSAYAVLIDLTKDPAQIFCLWDDLEDNSPVFISESAEFLEQYTEEQRKLIAKWEKYRLEHCKGQERAKRDSAALEKIAKEVKRLFQNCTHVKIRAEARTVDDDTRYVATVWECGVYEDWTELLGIGGDGFNVLDSLVLLHRALRNTKSD